MCGICGVFKFADTRLEITAGLLKRMTDTMRHRGPDDEGIFLGPDGRVGLGHRRLSIIDLSSAGRQPMCNEDASVWIVFNGEIYNYQSLRKNLIARGHRFKTKTDTEVILHLYEEEGASCVKHLDGMFAFAIWDADKQRMLLVRDRIGIKPLYYTVIRGQLIFASEIKAILKHPDAPCAVDERALYHYLTFITTPAPQTLFQDILKLPAGCLIECSSSGQITRRSYWDLKIRPHEKPRPEAYYTEKLRSLLLRSIADRMISDVPFGVFLSGGVDSSTNVALMSRLMDRPVDTFSVAVKGQEAFNEFRYARRIAKLFKANHHEILIDEQDFLDIVPQVIYHQDEPIADPVCFPLYYVSKLARDNGTIVIQVGEGSDEQFAGYAFYRQALTAHRWAHRLRFLPNSAKRASYAVLTPLLIAMKKNHRQNIVRNLFYDEEIFWGGAVAFQDVEKEKLLDRSHPSGESSSDVIRSCYNGLDTDDYLTRMIYWEFKNRLPELLLMRVDKVTMATSVEARVPFLDYKIVEFSMEIPSALKVKNGETKHILKKAFEGLIPREIIYRKKIGFTGSSKNLFTRGLRKFARNVLMDQKGSGYFRKSYVKEIFDAYEKRGQNYSLELWSLLNFELWYKTWILGEAI